MPWVLRPPIHSNRPRKRNGSGQVKGPLALERGERRDGILADKQSKGKQTCPARCAIAALLPSPNGNESACLPAASPAHHFINHQSSQPARPPASDSLLNPLVAVSILSVQIITRIIFPLLGGRTAGGRSQSVPFTFPPHHQRMILMELQFSGLWW